MRILGVDIGTSSMKLALFEAHDSSSDGGLRLVDEFTKPYEVRIYNNGTFGEVDPHDWMAAFEEGCKTLGEQISSVEAIGLSGTTPGLVSSGADREPLLPAVLMLDGRSRSQARRIISEVGLAKLLEATANMPVSGGCSLSTILWIQEEHPEIFQKTSCFAHSNGWFAAQLTGRFAIDPSSASLTALYNTTRNDLTWNEEILKHFGLSEEQLPELVPSDTSVGKIRPEIAKRLGFATPPKVIIGGNDAVLAAYSAGIQDPGAALDVNGTSQIALVCLDRCIPSTAYNIRAHVVPERWLTLYVMNAGGKAFQWFHRTFCRELSADEFFESYLPDAVGLWLDAESRVEYAPFLLGSRYSLDPMFASFKGMTETTTREELLAAMVRGLYGYQREHLKEISLSVSLLSPHYIAGGAVSSQLVSAKKRWMRDAEYVFVKQSSARGAAALAHKATVS
jgi:xylulokinase